MKIALVSDAVSTDDAQISRHFGRAPYYVVITLEEGREVAREVREKPTHSHGHGHHEEHNHDDIHQAMLAPIQDCDVLIAGGMGIPMEKMARRRGMEVVLTRLRSVDEAVKQYLAGELVHEARLAHMPGRH